MNNHKLFKEIVPMISTNPPTNLIFFLFADDRNILYAKKNLLSQ